MDIDHAAHLGSALLALCGPRDALAAYGIAAALFATGLFGGFAHCAPMCGPFVVAQLAGGGSVRRLAAGALPTYHLGRATTYVALGAAAGGTGGSLVQLAQFRWVFAALLAAAALCFLVQALGRIAPSIAVGGMLPGLSERWGYAVARIAAPLLRQTAGAQPRIDGYRLGIVLGLLPCGFLYAALIAAAAAGSAAAGALAMASFTLGTVPGLVAVGVLGNAALQRWRGLASAVAIPVFLLNAITLAGLAMRMMA